MSDDGNERLVLTEMSRTLCDAFEEYESARREGAPCEVLIALLGNIAEVFANALAQLNAAPTRRMARLDADKKAKALTQICDVLPKQERALYPIYNEVMAQIYDATEPLDKNDGGYCDERRR